MKLDDAERTPCEVWTRVMGYHRPKSQFNPGKRQEHEDRVFFEESQIDADSSLGLPHREGEAAPVAAADP